MFVERNTQYTSFSSRKQPANTGSERKQFTENASVTLQQTILTHARTKCPPVGFGHKLYLSFKFLGKENKLTFNCKLLMKKIF